MTNGSVSAPSSVASVDVSVEDDGLPPVPDALDFEAVAEGAASPPLPPATRRREPRPAVTPTATLRARRALPTETLLLQCPPQDRSELFARWLRQLSAADGAVSPTLPPPPPPAAPLSPAAPAMPARPHPPSRAAGLLEALLGALVRSALAFSAAGAPVMSAGTWPWDARERRGGRAERDADDEGDTDFDPDDVEEALRLSRLGGVGGTWARASIALLAVAAH